MKIYRFEIFYKSAAFLDKTIKIVRFRFKVIGVYVHVDACDFRKQPLIAAAFRTRRNFGYYVNVINFLVDSFNRIVRYGQIVSA